jgi:glycosyltransferase involved in cell wall biosynthesis
MRVLIVHNGYRQRGGEDTVVANEHALLDRHGWETRLWTVSNDAIAGAWSTVTAALRTPYSPQARDRLAAVIAEFRPEVVHVHNFFPLLSPSIYDACRDAGVAVVQTLHNFRTICAGGMLLRDGRRCEDCIGASPYHAVLHGCYRGSHIGSLPIARMIDVHRRRGTWRQKVDRFIALSAFAKGKFVAAGFPAERIAIKPNFTANLPVGGSAERAGALYVGRLSAEKGIATLLSAWEGLDAPLRLIGDGPLRGLVDRAAGARIVATGWLAPAAVADEMARAAFLVVPSIWPEGFPMVVVEALAQGLPIIASRMPALEEIVEDGVTGLLFCSVDPADLASKVRWACRHPKALGRMGAAARRVYEHRYSPEVNLQRLAKIYEAAIAEAPSASIGGPGVAFAASGA